MLGLWQELHRVVWRRIPRTLRRRLLLMITEALAPRPSGTPESSERFIVVGYLRACSGLGEAARLCYEALRASGATVAAVDISAPMMQGQDCTDFEFKDGSDSIGPGTLILHVNAPWVPFALLLLGRRFVRGKRIVGYWHWELPKVPREWTSGFDFVHEIWVPSRFVAKSLSASNPDKLVRIIPHPVALRLPAPRAPATRDSHQFVVLVIFNMGSSLARKNPLAAIEAFRTAVGDDRSARLVIKVSNSHLYPPGFDALVAVTREMKNVELLTRPLTAHEMDALYAQADVVMSLHRSEGFGFVVAEAMLHGLPVIATDWSGNCDFLNVSNGMPVRWTLVAAADPQGEYDQLDLCWADPDIDDASTKLRALRRDLRLRAELGERARKDVVRLFSAARYYDAVTGLLAKSSEPTEVPQ